MRSTVNPFELFTYNDGKYKINYRTMLTGPILQYGEKIEKMGWIISDETKTILGYSCQKATTSFKGRKYIAWFTTSIPIDGGPYKFSGLPGLILKVNDDNKSYDWEVSGIEKKKIPIYEKKLLYNKCNKAEANKIIENMFKNPYGFYKLFNIKIISQSKANPSISLYYDPIEKL